MLTVLDNCRVSPPPATVGKRSLPLTFFDISWLLFPPIHPLLFYRCHHSKTHFIQTVVPILKHSLSIALQHFFPFAGNLAVFATPNQSSPIKKPEIRHEEGDFVALTVAECTLDFDDLTGNHPQNCAKFYPLIPKLGTAAKVSDYVAIPLFCAQVTYFRDSGFSIGMSNHHALSDGSSALDFLNAWASIARNGTDELFVANGSLPFYDRSIKYPETLDKIFLSQPGLEAIDAGYETPHLVGPSDKLRATFVLTRENIDRIKKWASTKIQTLEHISSFSVVCAYVWTCLAKSRAHVGDTKGADGLEKFACAMDCRARLDPPVPQTYFGNCLKPCIAVTKSSILSGNKGFLTAIEVLGEAIKKAVDSKNGVIKDADTWLEQVATGVPPVGVTGSPKLKFYDLDFGWGKPKKYETVSLDYTGSISVNACRESHEGFEVGLSLPAKQMDAFVNLFRHGLESIFLEQQ